MKSELKKTSRDSVIYAIGNFFSGLGGIILIILYTKFLKPEEYGNYSLAIAAYDLILSIALGWIWRSTLRFKDSYSDLDGQKQFYSTIFILLGTIAAVLFPVILIILNMIKHSVQLEVYRLYLITTLVIIPESIYHIVNSVLRSERKVVEFNLNEIGITLLRIAGAIIFIKIVGMGAEGVLFGLITAYSIVALINIKRMDIIKYLQLSSFSRKLFAELLSYGVPLMGISITTWVLSLSDRYIIRYFFSAREVGIYSVNYSFGSSIIMAISKFIMLGAFPIIIKTWNAKGKKETEEFISSLLRYYFLIIIPALSGLIIMAEPLLRIMTTDIYAEGFGVMAIIALGTTLLGISEYTNKAWELTKRTKNILLLNLLAAISNIILNFIFVPRFGPEAAAVTTFAAYGIYLAVSMVASKSILRISINYKSLINVLISSAVMSALIAVISSHVNNSLISILLLAVFGVAIYFSGLLILGEIRDETEQVMWKIKSRHKQEDSGIKENQDYTGRKHSMPGMVSGPLISVIIPTHNRPEMLGRAIDSVLKQTYRSYEIIVVDDNSDCDNISVINSFKSSRIRYFRNNENLGGARTRNIGIQKSRGKYVAFLDDDDEFLPDKLYQQVQKLIKSKYKNLAFVYSKHICIDSSGRVVKRSSINVSGNVLKYHIINGITCTSCILFKRNVLIKVKGFRNLPSGQEYDLILRVLAEGFDIDCVDDFLVLYHIHEGERISTNDRVIEGKKIAFDSRRKYFYLLSEEEIRKICYEHYMSLFRFTMAKRGRIKALTFLFTALKYKILCIDNAKAIIVLLLGYSCCIKIRYAAGSLKTLLTVKPENVKELSYISSKGR